MLALHMSPTHQGDKSNSRFMEIGLFLAIVALPLVFVPISDSKMVVLLAGSLFLSLSRPRVDRGLALASGAWLLIVALAASLGVDPLWSLLGTQSRGTGLVALFACAVFLCAATSVGDDLRGKLPGWLFWAAVVVSAIAVVGRFVDIGTSTWQLGNYGSTLGHRVFVGGFAAAASIAATSVRLRARTFVGLLVVGSGLAVSAARSAWIAVAVGLLTVTLTDRRNWRKPLLILAPLILAVTAWTIADKGIAPEDKGIEFSAAPRFAQFGEGSAQERLPALRANLRAWRDHPVLGSGPGTGWYGYLKHVSPDEMRRAGRGFDDAHNLFVEMGATTGVLGVGSLVLLGLIVLARSRSAPSDRRWALGAAASLGVVHMVQPFQLVLTPLLFLTAGLAVATPSRRVELKRWAAVLAAAGLLVASTGFLARALEWYGNRYASEAAYRAALRIHPSLLYVSMEFAQHLAFDFRSQDDRAGTEARSLARGAVRDHSWHPQARLLATNIEVLLGDEASARRLLEEHLRLFPNDPTALSGAALLELRNGNPEMARDLARRTLNLAPDNARARNILQSLEDRP